MHNSSTQSQRVEGNRNKAANLQVELINHQTKEVHSLDKMAALNDDSVASHPH